jgi:phosphoribosylformimino-5-aminoimidazole carboxamide ribotide isomerase
MIIVPSFELPHPDAPANVQRPVTRDLLNDWEWLGFQRIQLIEPRQAVDRPLNRREIEEILRDSPIDVQVRGGIRSADDVEALLSAGASHVVLGSRALDEPDWLFSTVAQFPEALVVQTAARERRVRTRGWVRTLPVDVRDLADELSDIQLGGFAVTFAADAQIDNADLALVEDLTDRLSVPVIVGGGIPTLATLRDLEFRGVAAYVIDSTRLSESFDVQTLARSFVE